MPSQKVSIHEISDKHYCNTIVAIHMAALKNDILPAVGADFMNHYYGYIIDDKNQILLGAFFDGSLIGFCQVSFAHIRIFNILKENPHMLLRLTLMFLEHPVLFARGLHEALFSKNTLFPEIAFIAVHENHRGKGIGEMLIKHASHISKTMGHDYMYTKTSEARVKEMYRNNSTLR